MYAWLWQHLPGPTAVRGLLAALLAAIAVVVLFTWGFPWVESHLEYDDTQVPQSQQPEGAAR
jgi:hypothetical protein